MTLRGCATPSPDCCGREARARRRPGMGRRMSGRWRSFTKNCSAALPEANGHIAGAEAQPQIHRVLPLVVVLEVAAGGMAHGEIQGAAGVRNDLAGGIDGDI